MREGWIRARCPGFCPQPLREGRAIEEKSVSKEQVDPNAPSIVNLATQWPETERKNIARAVCQQYRDDKAGRKEWEDKRNRYYKLWLGHREPKTEPWANASNVCLPLLAVACNQFHARSYQAFFAPPLFVKAMPVGMNDITRSKNVESFMNWQILYDMKDYEDETDKLLLNVPISGTNFKKVYYDPENERPVSEYISGVNVVLPYRTKNLDSARRIVHEIYLHYDELMMRNQRPGFYVDFDKVSEHPGSEENKATIEQTKDEIEPQAFDSYARPKLLLEQHGWWKFRDKIQPFIFLVDYDSETLMRATSRIAHGTDKIMNYWTDYHFIPNPEGYYSFGFGHFLETLNEMANTAFNQIFDAGRLTNQPFGFYGRRAGVKKKEIKLRPGHMEEVEDATQVFFPSMQRVDQVLFQALGLIQQYTEQFTSTSDYIMGREAKGVKTPTATGTQSIIEQGLIIFGVMIKRLFRSLKKELGLIYAVDQLYLPETKQYRVMEAEDKIAFPTIRRADFDGHMDVIPVGDPTYASRLTRRQEAMELYQMILANPLLGAVDPRLQVKEPKAILAATREVLETYDRKTLFNIIPELPPAPMAPTAENALFMQGDRHDPLPGEDHLAHLEAHLQFKQTPFFAAMRPEYQALVAEHIDKTRAMLYEESAMRQAFGGQGNIAPVGPAAGPGPGMAPVPPDDGGQGGFVPPPAVQMPAAAGGMNGA